MFREINVKHGNLDTRKVAKLKDKIVICPKKGPKRHGLRRFEAKEEIKGN